MMMRASIAVLASATLFVAGAAYAGPIQDRMLRQDARIDQGVASGALTPRETQRLESEQDVIARTRGRALADGSMTPSEARRITWEQNRASRDIYRLKHNDRTW
jgi:hypothetical protein